MDSNDKNKKIDWFKLKKNAIVQNNEFVEGELENSRCPMFRNVDPYQQNFLERSPGWQTTSTDLGFG